MLVRIINLRWEKVWKEERGVFQKPKICWGVVGGGFTHSNLTEVFS
jgi:hypothetical protein